MTSIVSDAPSSKVIVGVDTHKHIHVAVAINQHGTRLGDRAVSADSGGYAQLEVWAQELGRVDRFGIEGTGSYGAGLTSYLRRCGHRVVEVNRGDRRSRRSSGKSDAIDAEAAARSVLAGTSTAVPKTTNGLVEMIRQVKVARDTARKGRTSAIITLKTLIVNAPAELRESLDGLTNRVLINRCARFRVSAMDSPTASAKHSLRALARRRRHLDTEVRHLRRRARRPRNPGVADTTRRLRHRSRPRGRGSSSCSATTRSGSAQRPPSRNSAAPAPSQRRQGKPAGTASTEADTDKPTLRSTHSPSYECDSTNPPSTTSLAAPPKASPKKTSSAASNGSSPARSTSES